MGGPSSAKLQGSSGCNPPTGPFSNLSQTPSVTMSKTTINIDLMDFAECLARLASLRLYMQNHDMPSIGVDRAVWRLTETNSEADAAWKKAQADALHHHTVIVPKLAALREEFAGKRIVQDHIHVQP